MELAGFAKDIREGDGVLLPEYAVPGLEQEGKNLERGAFYFPIVTCIVLSVVLTGLMWLWQWINRR